MPTPQQQLLLIRLDVLDEDIDKVAGAVDRAKNRGDKIDAIIDGLWASKSRAAEPEDGEPREQSVTERIIDLKKIVTDVSGQVQEADDLGGIDESAIDQVVADIAKLEAGLQHVYNRVMVARASLRQLKATIVSVDDRLANQSSLYLTCGELHDKVSELRARASEENLDATDLRELWREYEKLLITEGRPLFAEYVDFLGGLTMRDTGLDDRVCEMTDVLLTGFTLVSGHYLPIPARQAALSKALDSVVKLGFPEWSVWGIPLVAHEVGLALARDDRQTDVDQLLGRWLEKASRDRLAELFADMFAAYTVGPAYGCALLLLRLHPHHDEDAGESEAKDVDRARLMLATLLADSDPETGYRRSVNRLTTMWKDAVMTLAEPEAARAAADALDPPAEADWLDEYLTDVLAVLDRREGIEHFSEVKWAEGLTTLGNRLEKVDSMKRTPASVLAVLNLAWAARLESPALSDSMSKRVRLLWEKTGNKR